MTTPKHFFPWLGCGDRCKTDYQAELTRVSFQGTVDLRATFNGQTALDGTYGFARTWTLDDDTHPLRKSLGEELCKKTAAYEGAAYADPAPNGDKYLGATVVCDEWVTLGVNFEVNAWGGSVSGASFPFDQLPGAHPVSGNFHHEVPGVQTLDAHVEGILTIEGHLPEEEP